MQHSVRPESVATAGMCQFLPCWCGVFTNVLTGLLVVLLQVAVYKDPSGEVQKFSGLCPHLGCLLQVGRPSEAYCTLQFECGTASHELQCREGFGL